MKRKLRVAIYTEGFFTGGTERQVIELIKGLDRSQFEVHALCSKYNGHMVGDLESAGIQVEYFPLSSLRDFNAVRQLRRLRRFLSEREIDVLHTFSLTGNTFAVLAGLLARVPVIVTSRRDMGVMIRPIYWPLQIFFSCCADAITTNAQAIKQMLIEKEWANNNKISVIYNGIDLARFTVERGCREQVRQSLDISPTAPVFGMVAQIKPVKGHQYLLEATARVAAVRPDARLLIVGDGDGRPELEALARQLGIEQQTLFLGQQSDVTRLVAAMDISILSSLSEGISNSLLEAMTIGTPVIATNVGGNPEIVVDNQTGLLVPAADSQLLAEAILRLIDDPALRARLAGNAQEMVFNRFSTDRMVSTFGQFYLNLLQAKQNRPGFAGLRRRVASA